MKAFFFTVLILFAIPAAVNAETLTSSTSTMAKSKKAKLALGTSAIVNVAAVRLSGEVGVLNLGVGFGIHYDLLVGGQQIRIGLYGAPELQTGTGSKFDAALLAYLGTTILDYHVGGGLAWDAYSVGGNDPGLHDLHRRHLLLYGSIGLPLF